MRGDTQGLLIEHANPQPGDRRFLVVVDARGDRGARAYFTAWHEIAHVLTTPSQLEFRLFRRTPAAEDLPKDPIESAVDHVAGAIAFYEPIFGPALDSATGGQRVTFSAIERAREAVVPKASLYATTMAVVRLRPEPLCFVRAELRLKPAESRKLHSPQQELGLGLDPEIIAAKLRLIDVIANDAARRSGLRLHEHLRVPPSSLLSRIHAGQLDGEHDAHEDQSSWETSADGPLPAAPLRIVSTRRGGSVYALISAA